MTGRPRRPQPYTHPRDRKILQTDTTTEPIRAEIK